MLENVRWEKVCLGIARGMTQAEAYAGAGYKTTSLKSADAACSRLLKDQPQLQARIEEIRTERAAVIQADDALTRAWVVERLMKNAMIAMGEEKVKITKKDGGGEAEVVMRDAAAANQALQLLGKELGMFVERTENTHVVRDITDEPVSAEQWERDNATAH